MILNNRGYSALKAFGLAMGIETLPGVNLPGIEFVNLAIGFGVTAERIERAERLAPALRESFETPGPLVARRVGRRDRRAAVLTRLSD